MRYLILLLLIACQADIESVTLERERPCEDRLGNMYTCQEVTVSCNDLNERRAILRITEQPDSIGTIVFTSNGAGNTFYGNAAPNVTLGLMDAGYNTVEIAWQGEYGWAQDNYGAGIPDTMCAYAEVVRYLSDDVLCATGNSGGAMQVSYGLAHYNLDDVLTTAVLTGGPPTADAVDACRSGRDGVNTAKLLDYVFGFDKCQAGDVEGSVDYIDANSVVHGDMEYTTFVSFILGSRDPLNIARAQKYYDVITSEKKWMVLDNVPHSVHKDTVGGQAIVNELLTYCR